MLTLQETLWQLARNKGRTVILVLASAMLAGCVAFYLGNIRANEEAIEALAESTAVTVSVSNSTGQNQSGLNISVLRYENFIHSPYLEDFRSNGVAVGAYAQEAREKPIASGNDCSIVGVSHMDCLWDVTECEFLEGYDGSFLEGSQPLCLMYREFAKRNGMEPGDQISLPVWLMNRRQGGVIDYTPVGEHSFTIVGLFDSTAPMELYVPVQWLREAAEAQGERFTYAYLYASMKDPRQLNRFKEGVEEMGFLEPDPEGQDEWEGAFLAVEDQNFITAAEEFGRSIVVFRRFQTPFFLLVLAMIVLAIFLIMRGSRRVMAISISLGRSKLLCAMGCFLAALFAELAGCALVFPAMVFLAGLSAQGGLMICGAFLLCACIGDAAALILLLRFNAFTLLTAAE